LKNRIKPKKEIVRTTVKPIMAIMADELECACDQWS